MLEVKRIQSPTVQDIIQRAEVNRSTFFARFSNKFALLENTVQYIFQLDASLAPVMTAKKTCKP